MEYRVPIIIALVVLLIVVFIWKRRKGGKTSKKGGKKTSKKVSKRAPVRAAKNTSSDEDYDASEFDDDESEENEKPAASGDIAADARELYDLVHNDLAGGMQIDAFEDAAGDLAGDDSAEVFVALKQKYTEAIDANRDPSRSISVKDYIEVLKKSG